MSHSFRCIIGLLVVFCIADHSKAAVTLTVDLDTETAGIQSFRNLQVGEVITVGILLDVGEIAGDDGINAYQFGIQYDTNELAIGPNTLTDFDADLNPFPTNVLRTPPFQPIPIPPFVRSFESFGSLDLTQSGIIENIAAGSNSFTINNGFSQQIFEFTLVATAATGDTDIDVIPTIGSGQGFIVSNNSVDPPVDFFVATTLVGGSVSVTAVPEPSSLAILAIGGVYLGRRKLRRSDIGCRTAV